MRYMNTHQYFKCIQATGYDIEKIINNGVQYEITKNITITEEEKIFIVNENIVPFLKIFQIIKFV